ncbi:hypothetical protein ACFLR5_01800 [Elusimicrobiota bacterium]
MENLGISVCLDLGHFISHGFDHEKPFYKYIDRTKVIHIYGTDAEHRHLSLSRMKRQVMVWFNKFIRESEYNGIITLEVFSEKDLIESLEIINETEGKEASIFGYKS